MVSSIARARVVFHTTERKECQKVIPRNETKGGRKKEYGCKKPHRAYLLRRITRSAIRICRLPVVVFVCYCLPVPAGVGMLQQHWRFEEYEWGMVLDDVRLRPVLHVVVVVAGGGLSVLMIHEWVVILPLVLFVVLLLLLLVSLSSALPHYYRYHSEQNSSPALLFPFFPLLP